MNIVLLIGGVTAVVLIARSLASIVTRGHENRTRRAMYGLSGHDDDALRLRDILTRALSESTNEIEFEDSYRRSVGHVDELGDPCSWTLFTAILYEDRLSDTETLTPRVLAERYLKDIECRCQLRATA